MIRGRYPRVGSEYYLPKETFRMVQHFCLSYKELKEEANDIKALRSPSLDGMPHGSSISNPTEREGIRLADVERKIAIIENAIADVSPSEWLFLAVTEGKSFRELVCDYGCPYGEYRFSMMKRMVYWKVSKEI